jgi:predicted nucleotide-binding protein
MSVTAALTDMNNAILDLQGSDYNTYERPLKKLARAIASDDLKDINDKLKAGVDFDKFVEDATKQGMGGDHLNWPDDKLAELGLILIIIEKGAADPRWFMNFGHNYFYSGSKLIAGIRKMTSSVIIPFSRDYKAYVEEQVAKLTTAEEKAVPPSTGTVDMTKVFIVHGQDELAKITLARVIEQQGLEAVILHEQVSKGMTIPEKLTHYGKVGFAVVLLTPDDVGRRKDQSDDQPRARQNVIMELGFFLGMLGRDKVFALLKDDIEMPSDYVGVVYEKMDAGGAWKTKLGHELEAAGFKIDFRKIGR